MRGRARGEWEIISQLVREKGVCMSRLLLDTSRYITTLAVKSFWASLYSNKYNASSAKLFPFACPQEACDTVSSCRQHGYND